VSSAATLARIGLAIIVGFLGTRVFWVLLRPTLVSPVFARSNYRKHRIATAGGICIVASVFLVESIRALSAAVGWGSPLRADHLGVLIIVGGFGFLGLVDDLGAEGNTRGFRGHIRALGNGSLTTGGLKLIGGALIAVLVASIDVSGGVAKSRSIGSVIIDALTIALGANLANLFDRAPGRTVKVSTLFFLVLIGAIALFGSSGVGNSWLVSVAVVVGSTLGLLHEELRERVMLGDTGSNVIGAAIGYGVTLATSTSTTIVVMVVLIGLNLLSELISFSRVIDSFPPFRWFDFLGALPARRDHAGNSGNRTLRGTDE
jgi:UDP-GlcNAc:undecaprenyl-phosphate/decaprenyl-phosphate GlcNAc-1-phosphate transferase